MATNKKNRKAKIDPAFYKVVKYYVTILEDIEKLPKEGTLSLPENFIGKSLVDSLGWKNLNEPMGLENFLKFTNKIGISEKKKTRLIIDFISSMDDSDNILKLSYKMVKSLPEEESRTFYSNELKSFSSSKIEESMDFFSIAFSLFLRYIFITLEGDPAKTTKKHIEYFKKTNVMSTLINVLNYVLINLAYQKTMPQIEEDIRNGNDKSLFKALTINKSILFTEEVKNEVKNRFIQAQLAGDAEFFKKAGKAIANNPLTRKGQYGKTYSVLALFWYTGLYKLKNSELHDFLVSCDLTPPKPENFQRFVKRNIRSVFPTVFPI